MSNQSANMRLGDLLTACGFLKPADLRQAMLLAKQQGLPVGRILILSGYISEGQLKAAIVAQSLLRDSLIELDMAMKALHMVALMNTTMEDALSQLGWQQASQPITNKLGDLLLAADILPVSHLDNALRQSQSAGLPLGRVLAATNLLSEQMLSNALDAQVLIRDKQMTREQAIAALKEAKETGTMDKPPAPLSGDTGGSDLANNIRLGELLIGAALVDEPSILSAVEIGLLEEEFMGRILIKHGLAQEEVVAAALELQHMVRTRMASVEDAIQSLRLVYANKLSAQQALFQIAQSRKDSDAASTEKPDLPLYQFLQLANLISAKEVENAIRIGSRDSELMGKMLVLVGMDENLISAAKQAHDLVLQCRLTAEQAIIALKHCQLQRTSLIQAFQELGWLQQPKSQARTQESTTETTLAAHTASTRQAQSPESAASTTPYSPHVVAAQLERMREYASAGSYPQAQPQELQPSIQKKRLIDLVPKNGAKS